MLQRPTKALGRNGEDDHADAEIGVSRRSAEEAFRGRGCGVSRALLVAFFLCAVIALNSGFALGAGRQAQSGAGLMPQKIVSLLLRYPNYLPDFSFKGPAGDEIYFSYWEGTFQPVSPSEKADGIIANFVMAFEYKMPNPTTAFAYRIFRDEHSAQQFFSNMSMLNKENLVAPGFQVTEREDTAEGTVFENRGLARRPVVCDFYATAAAPNVAVMRCSALAKGFPVIVSGIRTETIDAGQANRQGIPFRQSLEQSEQAYSLGALGSGLVRLQSIAPGH